MAGARFALSITGLAATLTVIAWPLLYGVSGVMVPIVLRLVYPSALVSVAAWVGAPIVAMSTAAAERTAAKEITEAARRRTADLPTHHSARILR